jgi:Terpene cyclase DEP1
MRWLSPVVWFVALAFGAFSMWVLLQVGYLGIWQGGFANPGSTQITVDLVIACAIAMGFVARDCRSHGRAWWPWAVLTAAGGSLGLLAYLLWNRR